MSISGSIGTQNKMPKYKIQQRIRTLSENAVGVATGYPSFTAEDIIFSHWEFNHRDGWAIDAWLAEYEVEAEDAAHAHFEFKKRLFKVIPRVSLIGQSYIQYLVQPYLITKEGSDIAFLYYPFDVGPTGLMFQEEEKKALDLLLADKSIPEEFFLYWNDAVNSTGYSSKLLIMFSALDALIKKQDGTKDFALRKAILGQELKDKIYAQGTGLRHRLVHGEYFSDKDDENYMELVHKKVVAYFNDVIFQEKLIEENVTGPQRHFFDNDNLIKCWIKQKDEAWPLELRKVLEDCDSNQDSNLPQQYQLVHDDKLNKSY
jgi:hypothetical protein